MSAVDNSQVLKLLKFSVEEVIDQKDLLWGYVDAVVKSDTCTVSVDTLKDFCFAICAVDDIEGTNTQSMSVNKFYHSNETYLRSLSSTEPLELSGVSTQPMGYSDLPKLQLARVLADAMTLALQTGNLLKDCWYCCESTRVVSKAVFGSSHKVLDCPTDLVSDNAETGLVLSRLREIRDILMSDVSEDECTVEDSQEYESIFSKLARCEKLLFDFTSEDKRSVVLNKLNFTQADLQSALLRYMPKMEIPECIVKSLDKDSKNFVSKYFISQVVNDDSNLIAKKASSCVTVCHNGFLQVFGELVERGYRQHGGAVSANVMLLSRDGKFPYKYKLPDEGVSYPKADVSSAVNSLLSKIFIESGSSVYLEGFIEVILYAYSNILCKTKYSMEDIKEMCK